jgi:acetyltransferase-like isoleucine patch superfamily enzyme
MESQDIAPKKWLNLTDRDWRLGFSPVGAIRSLSRKIDLMGGIGNRRHSAIGFAPPASHESLIALTHANSCMACPSQKAMLFKHKLLKSCRRKMKDSGTGNTITICENSKVNGEIIGNNNHVSVEKSSRLLLNLKISGSNNKVIIGRRFNCEKISIFVGNRNPANGTTVVIGDDCSAERDCRFYVYNSGNVLKIGNECMFSNSIVIRTGESPHLIFDDITGEYIDTDGHVEIGDHCWIGEGAYITKRASLAKNTIVAARSVVTRRFVEEMTMIAGNPAVLKKRNLRWIRNRNRLPEGSRFKASYDDFLKKHEV